MGPSETTFPIWKWPMLRNILDKDRCYLENEKWRKGNLFSSSLSQPTCAYLDKEKSWLEWIFEQWSHLQLNLLMMLIQYNEFKGDFWTSNSSTFFEFCLILAHFSELKIFSYSLSSVFITISSWPFLTHWTFKEFPMFSGVSGHETVCWLKNEATE